MTKDFLLEQWSFGNRYAPIIRKMFDTDDPHFKFNLMSDRLEKVNIAGSGIFLSDNPQEEIPSDLLLYATGYRIGHLFDLISNSINRPLGNTAAISLDYNWVRLKTTGAPVRSVKQVVVNQGNGQKVELPIYFDSE